MVGPLAALAYPIHAAAAALALAAVCKQTAARLANWRPPRAGLPAPHRVEPLGTAATRTRNAASP